MTSHLRGDFRKVTRSTTKDSILAKELEEAKRRNASLITKLKKVKSDNKRLEESMGDRSFVRLNSTMRVDNSENDHNSVLKSSMSNLSFASLNIPECKPVDGEKEIDRKSFEQWKHMLEASMQLAGVIDEITKFNIFTIKAGAKLLDILEGTVSHFETPDIDTFPYANAIQRLKAFFGSRDYIFMQRQKLRSLMQNPGESDVKYVKRVIAIAKLCDFSDSNLTEQVADSIQLNALNRKIREVGRKILRKGGSLGDLLDKVRTLEMEQLNEDLFEKHHHQAAQLAVAAVIADGQRNQRGRYAGYDNARHHLNTQNYNGGINDGFGNMRNDVQQRISGNWRLARGGRGSRREFPRNASSRVPCWRCWSRQHQPSECYAVNQVCRNCHIKGHFERACHQQGFKVPSTGPTKRRFSNDNNETQMRSKKIATIEKDEVDSANETHSNLCSIKTDAFITEGITRMVDVKRDTQILSKVEVSSEDNVTGAGNESMTSSESIMNFGEFSYDMFNNGTIMAQVAGVQIPFLIDSGAEVNTVGSDTFDILLRDNSAKLELFCITKGSDKTLRAYAMLDEIEVVATFVAELIISDDRPRYMEKFYAVRNARALLGRSTSLRYSVLQLGLTVPIRSESHFFPVKIRTLLVKTEFPKFNMAPVVINYDKSMSPSRKIYTNIPPAFRVETERRLNDLLESGIIERVTDNMDKSYCSSLLVVPKGKNDIRLVVDLRGPNKAIIRSPFKMPTLECIMADLPNCKWFSTIDMTSAFFHIVLDAKSRHLTNFFASDGMYRFKRLPFGLTNAPDIFQETLQTVVLAGCKGVRNYLDDVLVFGKTKEEHDENLKVVMERLREHNVCINQEKSVFAQQSVKFLGFKMSEDGLEVEEEKIKAIREFRRPETQQEVKSFLGLMNFTERFILCRAEKTEHLRQLAKSDYFYWNDEL
ncbi:uncharacterized protein LOC131678576 isoform X2 [Topomyia yanbarensis]|uniref:uncharacterized protein LOC131678576 isoform X2 n=1 Tax=Topomyia yanbarensis TaxID=2498891 RepID=UPI00273CD8F6|nr:uncharacterized protein LOC131678576 isoform X2 [Topomyia yanbarensis]